MECESPTVKLPLCICCWLWRSFYLGGTLIDYAVHWWPRNIRKLQIFCQVSKNLKTFIISLILWWIYWPEDLNARVCLERRIAQLAISNTLKLESKKKQVKACINQEKAIHLKWLGSVNSWNWEKTLKVCQRE